MSVDIISANKLLPKTYAETEWLVSTKKMNEEEKHGVFLSACSDW